MFVDAGVPSVPPAEWPEPAPGQRRPDSVRGPGSAAHAAHRDGVQAPGGDPAVPAGRCVSQTQLARL